MLGFARSALAASPCSSTPDQINVRSAPYSARGDGMTDDTAAINAALADAAKATPPIAVYAPAGAYAYAGVLNVAGVELHGDGAATRFVATTPELGVIVLTGVQSALHDCTIVSPNAKKRSQKSNSAAVCLDGATKFHVEHVTIGDGDIPGSASAGILCCSHPSGQGTLANNTVRNTLADGIHLTHGSHDIVVRGNTVQNSGDDMIACVSYRTDPVVDANITIENNQCLGGLWGRGITVVGGNSVTIRNNHIENSNGPGVLVAAERGSGTQFRGGTMGARDITVDGNTIRASDRAQPDPNTGTAFVPQGAIFVYSWSGDNPIENVTLSGNTISEEPSFGIRVGAHVKNLKIIGNTIHDAHNEGIYINHTFATATDGGAADVSITGNTIQNCAVPAIRIDRGTRGLVSISDNIFSDCTLVPPPNAKALGIIYVDAGATQIMPLRFRGNRYDGFPAITPVSFIQVDVSAHSVGADADEIQRTNHVTPK